MFPERWGTRLSGDIFVSTNHQMNLALDILLGHRLGRRFHTVGCHASEYLSIGLANSLENFDADIPVPLSGKWLLTVTSSQSPQLASMTGPGYWLLINITMRSPVPSGSSVVFVMVSVYGTVFPVSGNFWSKSVAIEKPLPCLN